MFDNLRKRIYFKKAELLFLEGIKEGLIKSFDDELYEKLNHTYINGIPVSIDIKYLRPIIPPGKCEDRSLYIFFCFDDAILVRADTKNLELLNGKEKAGHGWIELGDYVYDTTIMASMPKSLYYSIFKPTDIRKCTIEEYCKVVDNESYYKDIKSTTLDDLRPHGRKRLDLYTIIPLVKVFAESSGNKKFQEDLDKYLTLIEYDEKEIQDEMDEALKPYLDSHRINI